MTYDMRFSVAGLEKYFRKVPPNFVLLVGGLIHSKPTTTNWLSCHGCLWAEGLVWIIIIHITQLWIKPDNKGVSFKSEVQQSH